MAGASLAISCLNFSNNVRDFKFLFEFFHLAKSLVAARRAFANSFVHIVDRGVKVMPFRLEFCVALRANKGL